MPSTRLVRRVADWGWTCAPFQRRAHSRRPLPPAAPGPCDAPGHCAPRRGPFRPEPGPRLSQLFSHRGLLHGAVGGGQVGCCFLVSFGVALWLQGLQAKSSAFEDCLSAWFHSLFPCLFSFLFFRFLFLFPLLIPLLFLFRFLTLFLPLLLLLLPPAADCGSCRPTWAACTRCCRRTL